MVTFVRYPTTDWGPPFGRLLKPHKSKMEGDIQVRFYRDCIYTSYILQLEERPWRCLPEHAEGDRKVGCRRPTFLKSAKRRQMIWFYRLGSHVFSDARERMDRSGESQKVIIRITCRGFRQRRSSGSPRSTYLPPWAGRCACRAQHAFRASSPYRHRSSWPTAIRSPCRIGNLR